MSNQPVRDFLLDMLVITTIVIGTTFIAYHFLGGAK